MTGEVNPTTINLNPPSKRAHSSSIANAHQSHNPHDSASDAECPKGKARRIDSGPGPHQTLNATRKKISTMNELSKYLNEVQAELKSTRTKKEKESKLMRLTENYQVMKIHLIKEKISNTTLVREKESLEKDNRRLKLELEEVKESMKRIDREIEETKDQDVKEKARNLELEEQLAEEKDWIVKHRKVLHSRFEKINSLEHQLRSRDEEITRLKDTIEEKEKTEGALRERIKNFEDKLHEIRSRVSSEWKEKSGETEKLQ
ncbi:hypothetical protein V866_007069 [Kwoniella sp. B9012]